MARKKALKLRKSLILRLAAVIVLVLLILWGIAAFPGTTHPGFQEYRPAVLPAGLKVASSELLIEKYPQFWPKFNKLLNLQFNHQNSWIEENKSDGQNFYAHWCSGYNSGLNCKEYQTSGGQHYLFTDSTNQGGDYSVYFIKGGTSIWITLREYPPITQQEWGKIIDGFQPTKYPHPKIINTSTKGP
jgi:hypothetical protein